MGNLVLVYSSFLPILWKPTLDVEEVTFLHVLLDLPSTQVDFGWFAIYCTFCLPHSSEMGQVKVKGWSKCSPSYAAVPSKTSTGGN